MTVTISDLSNALINVADIGQVMQRSGRMITLSIAWVIEIYLLGVATATTVMMLLSLRENKRKGKK